MTVSTNWSWPGPDRPTVPSIVDGNRVDVPASDVLYRVDVTDGSPVGAPTWATNALRFVTFDDARKYAVDLLGRWLAAKAARVVGVDTPDRELVDPADPTIVVNWGL